MLGQNRWITLACQLPFILCTYLQIGHFTHTLKPTCSASRCLSVHLPSYNGTKKVMNQNFHFYKAKLIFQTKIKDVWQCTVKLICRKNIHLINLVIRLTLLYTYKFSFPFFQNSSKKSNKIKMHLCKNFGFMVQSGTLLRKK